MAGRYSIERELALDDFDPRRNPWLRRASRLVYENAWISVREDDVIRPDGQPGLYGVVTMKSWALGIVPLAENGDTFLVGQYRYSLEQYSWEIPQGGGAKDASPLVGAQRELREETGLSAARWAYLGETHTSNSVTDEVGCLFLAEALTAGPAEPDGTEQLRLWRLPLRQAWALALSGEISDAISIVGLARAVHFLDSDRTWQPIERAFPGFGRRPG